MDYNLKKIITGIKGGKYKLLGIGSSRIVYDLNDGNVIKVAKDIRGVYQNTAENQIYSSSKSNFFAEVIAISEDNRCLLMPKAEKIKNIHTVYKYYDVNNIKSLTKLDNLSEDIINNNLSKGDLIRASNWGLINNVPLIIDYGLTNSIYRKYYGLNVLFKRYKRLHYL